MATSSSSQDAVSAAHQLDSGVELTARKSGQFGINEVIEQSSSASDSGDYTDHGADATNSTKADRYNMDRMGKRFTSPVLVVVVVDQQSRRKATGLDTTFPSNGHFLFRGDGYVRMGIRHLLHQPRLDRRRQSWAFLVDNHPRSRIHSYCSINGRNVIYCPNSRCSVPLGFRVRPSKMAKATEFLHWVDIDNSLAGGQRHWGILDRYPHSDNNFGEQQRLRFPGLARQFAGYVEYRLHCCRQHPLLSIHSSGADRVLRAAHIGLLRSPCADMRECAQSQCC